MDTIYPLINFSAPTPANCSGGTSFIINATLNELNIANITYSWNRTNYVFNETGSNLTSWINGNFTFNITSLGNNNYVLNITQFGLLPGIWYPYNLSIIDKANNFNTTETRWQTGNTPPAINFTAPTTFTGNYSRNWILANLSANDSENNLDTAIVYLYNSTRNLINQTSSSSNRTSINIYLNYSSLSNGRYYLNATANDSQNEISSTLTYTILLDTNNPGVVLNTPSHGYYSNSSSLNFSANLTDNLGIKNISLLVYNNSNYLSNITHISFVQDVLSSTSGLTVSLSDNYYNWSYYISDWAGNSNITGNRTLTIDTTNPLISYGANIAVDYSNLSQSWIYVNISFTEINFANITFYLYNNTATVNSTVFSTQTYSINWTNLPVANYTYQVNITDLANNKNSTQIYHIWVDNIAPNITLNTPSNNTYTNVTSQNLTANLSDIGVGIQNTTIFVYNQTGLFNSTAVIFASDTLSKTVGVVITFIDNIYTWFYGVVDFANNIFISNVNRTLTIDTVAPRIRNITYSPNTNDTIDPSTLIWFNATISDTTSGVANVILQIYNGSAWRNYTMNLINGQGNNSYGNYSANITTLSSEENYSFAIWTNDTTGNVNKSINYTFKSSWDCTWNVNVNPPSAGGYVFDSVGGFYEERLIGNITFKNTGDEEYWNNNCSLRFGRTAAGDSWLEGNDYDEGSSYLNLSMTYYLKTGPSGNKHGLRYYLNGNSMNNITLNASEVKSLVVKGLFTKVTTAINEYPSFPVFSSINDTEARIGNVTILISSPGMVITPGAYLETGLEPSSQTIYLTPGNFSIAGYVKNLIEAGNNPQNNTAYNISLNISVPSAVRGLLASGDMNKTIEKINNTNKNYSNLTFSLTSSNIVSLSTGSYTFYSYAYGYENSTGNLSLIVHTGNQTTINNSGTITFACYSVSDSICVDACINTTANLVYDPDCSLPTTTVTTTSSSGGGGG